MGTRGLGTVTDGNADLTYRNLGPSDVGSAFALYERIFRKLPYGFLARRSIGDFVEGLAEAHDRVAIGAFSDDTLIGYSMCRLAYRDGLIEFPLMRELRPHNQQYWAGIGMVVDPRFRGHRLMAKLLKARAIAARSKGVMHFLGLVAIGNRASLAGMLRGGFWIAGLEEDEYCLNYLCYEGPLQDCARTSQMHLVDAAAVDELVDAFAHGWVGTGIHRGPRSGPCVLRLERLD